MEFFRLKKIKEAFAGFFDRDKEKLEITPYRDWMLSLIVFLALLVFGVGVGYGIFFEIEHNEFVADVTDSENVIPLDRERMNKVIQKQEKKRILFEKIKDSL